MVENKTSFIDLGMLQAEELFFPRNEEGELVAKKVYVKVGTETEIVKEKVKKKEKKLDDEGKETEIEIEVEVEVDKEISKDKMVGIMITPLPRGEWIELMTKSDDGETTKDQDTEMLEKHLISPKVKAEDLTKSGKHFLIAAIVSKIFEYSGLTIDKKQKKK